MAGFEDLPLINASRNLSLAARYTHELGSEEIFTWENRRGLQWSDHINDVPGY